MYVDFVTLVHWIALLCSVRNTITINITITTTIATTTTTTTTTTETPESEMLCIEIMISIQTLSVRKIYRQISSTKRRNCVLAPMF